MMHREENQAQKRSSLRRSYEPEGESCEDETLSPLTYTTSRLAENDLSSGKSKGSGIAWSTSESMQRKPNKAQGTAASAEPWQESWRTDWGRLAEAAVQ
eukprot:5341936-Amphidinium_carterae.1